MKNHPLIKNKGGKGRLGLMRLIGKLPNAKQAALLSHKALHNKMVGIK